MSNTFNPDELFKKRMGAHAKELSRYLKFMFNDHLAFAMIFFVIAFAYFYQQWLQSLPDDFPTSWILGIVFGLILTYSPIRTLLKKPDLVFLLPAESKMPKYFRWGLLYSFVIQAYVVVIISAVFAPLYFSTISGSTTEYLTLVGLLLIFKWWNLLATWWMLKQRDNLSRLSDHLIRFGLNAATMFFIVQGDAWFFAGITTVILWGILMYDYSLSQKQGAVAWDLLIAKEQAHMQSFYRLANLFTDVPHVQNRVKKRPLLTKMVIVNVPFKYQQTFDYLFRITFVRSSDYLGMYIRLLLLALFFIYWIPNEFAKIGFSLLFLYLSGFQLMTLWNHHRTVAWIDLYPVPLQVRQQSLLKWLLTLLIVKTLILGLAFVTLQLYTALVIVIAGGAIFSYAFVFFYIKKRLN